MTQTQLASAIGIEPSTLSRIENGVIGYTQAVLEGAAAALRCSVADLLDRHPDTANRDEFSRLIDALPEERRAEALAVLRILTGHAA